MRLELVIGNFKLPSLMLELNYLRGGIGFMVRQGSQQTPPVCRHRVDIRWHAQRFLAVIRDVSRGGTSRRAEEQAHCRLGGCESPRIGCTFSATKKMAISTFVDEFVKNGETQEVAVDHNQRVVWGLLPEVRSQRDLAVTPRAHCRSGQHSRSEIHHRNKT